MSEENADKDQLPLFKEEKGNQTKRQLDKMSNFMELVENISEGTSITCTINRENEDGKWLYLDTIKGRVLPHETVKKKYGGGTYRLVYQFNGDDAKKHSNTSFIIRIAGAPKPIDSLDENSNNSVVGGKGVSIPGLDPLALAFLQMNNESAQKSEKLLLTVMGMMSTMVTGNNNQNQNQNQFDPMKFIEMNDRKNDRMLDTLTNVFSQKAEDEAANNEDDMGAFEKVVDKVLDMIDPLIDGIMSGEIDVGKLIAEMRSPKSELTQIQRVQLKIFDSVLNDPDQKKELLDIIGKEYNPALKAAIEKTL